MYGFVVVVGCSFFIIYGDGNDYGNGYDYGI